MLTNFETLSGTVVSHFAAAYASSHLKHGWKLSSCLAINIQWFHAYMVETPHEQWSLAWQPS